MENQSVVGTGGLRLPVGFRFNPTDEELVVHYLKRKAFNYPLPASIIAELDALRADPRDLPGNWKEKRYFFANNRERKNGNKTSSSSKVVASGRGYWKPFGKETKILAPRSNMVIGFKKSLAFYESGKRLHGTKTPWLMHEFRLITSKSNPNSSQHLGNWVVRCVFQKGSRRSRNENGVVGTRYEVGVLEEDSSNSRRPQPYSSPCSSGVTVASTDYKNGPQEESSSRPCSGFSSD